MVKITELAAQKVKEIQKVKNKENAFLRIYLVSEGCGIPNFGLTLEESKTDDDIVDEEYGISILTDIELAATLEGTIVDYIECKTGGGFEIRKPKMDHAEGCGGTCGSCSGSC
ncbi:iron-sulfur cluster assembly accessory protein [Desulfosporosinus sp. OT]|uniref:HesB/IscA family protein n=1 Tax=Desulfosporosinus sp. OT TaxID=913865 RepID=UPI000223A6CD|nr:iron-sulfur cluster assembly accessory protein [Desulfosporosinus sp. OT]EGW41908.1 iron-sulfur cluster biosynthesis family protein [Desulfosporosinus sp. OT]